MLFQLLQQNKTQNIMEEHHKIFTLSTFHKYNNNQQKLMI